MRAKRTRIRTKLLGFDMQTLMLQIYFGKNRYVIANARPDKVGAVLSPAWAIHNLTIFPSV